MPNFMLVSLNARFLWKIDLICLAKNYCMCENAFLQVQLLCDKKLVYISVSMKPD